MNLCSRIFPCWSSNSMERIEDENDDKTIKSKVKNFFKTLKSHFWLIIKFLPYLWPRGKYVIQFRVLLSLSFLFISKLLGLATPFALKSAVDQLGVKGASLPWIAVLLYGLGKMGGTLFQNLVDTSFVAVTQNALKDASLETCKISFLKVLVQHIFQLSLNFHIKKKTGSLLQIIERGTNAMSSLCQFTLMNILPIIIELTLVCTLLTIRYVFWITLIVIVDIIMYVVFTLSVTEWRTKFRREMNDNQNRANEKAVDALINYETVKYFTNESHETDRYKVSLEGYNYSAEKSTFSLGVLNVGQAVIIALGTTGVMMLTAYEITTGNTTVGDFVLVNTYMLQIYTPLNFLGTSYRLIKQALVDMEQMFDLLKQNPTVKDPESPVEFNPQFGEIEFDNVVFGYGDDVDNPVLKGVSFKVEAGKQLAVVGSSGAGKSTLGKLLFRFYDVTSGSIKIDGIDIQQIKQTDLRKNLGIVPQDTVLFNDTIRYNINYGNLDATEIQVQEAASVAKIAKFIEKLPEGWETKVGERGLRLSGGEKQRVAIARAVLKNPPIMLFDEATSALDTNTEKEIQDSLRDVFKGKTTTIILAHRLSTIIDSDEIIVMKDGKIVERGNHDALLQLNGEYALLWNKQMQKSEDRLKEKQEKIEEETIVE
jgi:ATP-binding cassette, subfamily B, heavy metal transporter